MCLTAALPERFIPSMDNGRKANITTDLKQICLPNIFRSCWLVSAGRVVVLVLLLSLPNSLSTILAKSVQTSSACTETVRPTAGGSQRLSKTVAI
jgi:hypothetical protein